ncbi:hypothetical protein JV173_00120 [Acholeplasma equirhinis]|uniref:hypothetical protein n=1 Tax=Acholeplasma equirhinis TaxID=555393 RepID=UPI00197AE4F9|nr:hypothetical protein [Acholeplasma equirhinis]MBN3489907.1 hypothetical protein [Acholeplasma equirhinis]
MTKDKIQYLISNESDLRVSEFFDYATLKEKLKEEIKEIKEFNSDIHVFLDSSLALNHTFNLPRMSQFKANTLTYKELKLMYANYSNYIVNLTTKVNAKKYLTIYADLISKDHVHFIQSISKELKLGKVKIYLVKDIHFNLFGSESNIVLLNDELGKFNLHMYHKGEYQMLPFDRFDEISFMRNLDTLYAYFKLLKEESLNFKFMLLSDDQSLIDKHEFLNNLNFEKVSHETLRRQMIQSYTKVKGF